MKKLGIAFIALAVILVFAACPSPTGGSGDAGPTTYGVVYSGNGNTGGNVPADSGRYAPGAGVLVKDAGTLVRTGYTFASWNTAANGGGTDRAPNTTFAMGAADVTLYAKWTAAASASSPIAAAAAAGSSSIVVAWTYSGTATGFNVYRGTSYSGTYIQIAFSLLGSQTSYTDTGLSSGTTYYYKVAAVGGSGEGPQSSPCSASTTTSAALGTPVISTVGTATSSSLTVTWGTVAGAISYTLYRDTSAAGSFTTQVAAGIAAASYTDTGLSSGTTYYYEVEATNGMTTSAKSSPLSGTTTASPPAVPVAPGAGTGTSTSSILVSWSSVSGATGYNVYRNTFNSSASAAKLNTATLSTTSYTDTSGSAGNDYYYFVTAVGPLR